MPPSDPEARQDAPPDALTRAGLVLGTPAYMAPEQARGDVGAVGARSDVYALGAILYELAAGRPPYAGTDSHEILRRVVDAPPVPLAELRPDLPPDFVALVERAMDRDPERRIASARTLGEEVEAFRRGLDLRVYEYGALEQVRRIVRRNRAASLALAAAIVALVAGLVASILFARSADRARESAVAETERTRAALERAEGQRLAAVASLNAERDPTLALLLGIEAARRAPGLESASALHSALDRLLERRELRGHEGYVFDVAFSPDGMDVASLAEDGTVRLWDAKSGLEFARIVAPRAISITWSPDGKSIAVADDRGGVAVHSARDGARIATLATPRPLVEPAPRGPGSSESVPFTRVAFDPSFARIAAASTNGLAAFFAPTVDARATWSSEVTALPAADVARPASIAFSPVGSSLLLVEGGASPKLVAHDSAYGNDDESATVPGEFGLVLAVAWSGDGERFATAESRRVRVWDATTLQVVRELPGLELDAKEPVEIVLSRRGDRLLQNRTVRPYLHGPWRAFDVDTGKIVAEGRGSCRAALEPEGRLLAAIDTEEENVVVLDARTGERVAATRGHRYGVTRVAFAPDGGSIVTASRDRMVRVFATAPGWTKETWNGLAGREILAFDGPTARAVVRSAPDRAVFVDGRTGAELGPPFALGAAAILLAFDARAGRLCAVAHRATDPNVPVEGTGVFDLVAGKLAYELPMAADGVVLASDGRDVLSLRGAISERDLASGAEIRSIPFAGRLLAASRDGRELVAWRAETPNVVELLERDTGEVRGRLEGHRGLVIDAEYSPDGRFLVTAAADATARLWSLADRGTVRTLRWPAIETLHADFDASGTRVLVRSGREVRVFSTGEDRELVALSFAKSVAASGVGAPIVARLAGFAPDDSCVALCEPDGRVRVSPIDPLPLAVACAPRELEPNEIARFQIGDEDARRAYARDFYERHPSASYQIGLARTALAAGDLDEAVRRFALAVEALPSSPENRLQLGVALARRASAAAPDARPRELDAAFDALSAARAAGLEPADFLGATELEPLHADPRWAALVAPR